MKGFEQTGGWHAGREVLQQVTNNLSLTQWARTLSLVRLATRPANAGAQCCNPRQPTCARLKCTHTALLLQTNRELRTVLPETFVLHVKTFTEVGRRSSPLVRGVTQCLDSHWRAAKVICLDFRGYPEDGNYVWEPFGHPPPPGPAGCVRVLRVTCSCFSLKWGGMWCPADGVPWGLPKWVAKVLPVCGNLTALHLRRVELELVPALPLLKHLLLEDTKFHPVLVASLQGLAGLETLHVSGYWYEAQATVWDVLACTGLRAMFMGHKLAVELARAGQDLRVPPACAVAIEFSQRELWRPWLVRLGVCLVDLRLRCSARDLAAASCASFMHAPQLMQLRHVTLIVTRYLEEALRLCVAGCWAPCRDPWIACTWTTQAC